MLVIINAHISRIIERHLSIAIDELGQLIFVRGRLAPALNVATLARIVLLGRCRQADGRTELTETEKGSMSSLYLRLLLVDLSGQNEGNFF